MFPDLFSWGAAADHQPAAPVVPPVAAPVPVPVASEGGGRAPAGGVVGVNGEFYEGGKFLPSNRDRSKQAPPPRWVPSPEQVAAREARRLEEEERAREAGRVAGLRAVVLSPLGDALADGRGGFCDSVAGDLRAGQVPRGRAVPLVADILARRAGRRNSKGYEAERARVLGLIEAAEAIG